MNFADHDMWTEIPNRFVLQNRSLNFVWTNDTFLLLNQKSWLGSRCSLLEQDQNYSAKESRAQTFANYVRRKSSLSFAYIWWLTTKALQLRYKSQDTERNIFNLAFVSNIINDNVSKFLLKRVKKKVLYEFTINLKKPTQTNVNFWAYSFNWFQPQQGPR